LVHRHYLVLPAVSRRYPSSEGRFPRNPLPSATFLVLLRFSYDRIIAATPAEESQLGFLYQLDNRKISIIPPGVDTSRFYPIPKDEARAAIGLQPTDRLLLFVGRIEPLKGVDTLLEAIGQLHTSGLQVEAPHNLAIVGGDPNASLQEMNAEMLRLQQLTRSLGIDDLVLFLGKRSQDALPYYYSAADAVVMPSHYESFGMVALEAMACGTPVVASQVGGLAFLVKDGLTGYVIPDGDATTLAERLAELLRNPELRNQLGAQAARYAQDFSWQIIAKRILQEYQSLFG